MAQTDATTYGFELEKAQAGQLVDLAYDHIESFAAEGAVEMGFGVVAGTDPAKQVAAASADTDAFVGIAAFTHKQVQGFDQSVALGNQSSTGAEYRNGDTVNVLRKGRIWVEVTNDGVAVGDAAYIDVTTAGEEGKFTSTSADNLETGGVFRTAGDTGELVVVELNLP